MNALEYEVLAAGARDLYAAAQGRKAAIIDRVCQTLGCSPQTAYRKLRKFDLGSSRKRRSDAGQTAVSKADLELLASVVHQSVRRNGKGGLPRKEALAMLRANGAVTTGLSASRLGVLMRQHGLASDQLSQLTAAANQRSLHPNHVWGIDASTCVLYYVKGGHLASMPFDEFNKNKPANLARVVNNLCTRYVMCDHFSGAFKVRYYAGGESSETVVDFLLYCISRQEGCPMHGVPLALMVDQGPGNTSSLFASVALALHIELLFTGVRNPRAKGFVEKPHDIVERSFEGRFSFLGDENLTLDAINGHAQAWVAAYCSTEKHSRTKATRYGVWMAITPEQLRLPPRPEVLLDLANYKREKRRIENDLSISFEVKGFGAQRYSLRGLPGVRVGERAIVCANVYRAPAIDVRCIDPETNHEYWQTVAPIELTTDGGRFPVDAPVIGQQYRAAPHTDVDRNRAALLKEAYGLPTLEEAERARRAHAQAYAGVVDAMADVRATVVPAYLPRRGVDLEPAAAPRQVEPPTVSIVEACSILKRRMGARYSTATFAWLGARYPDGRVPEPELAAIEIELLNGAEAPVIDQWAAAGGGA